MYPYRTTTSGSVLTGAAAGACTGAGAGGGAGASGGLGAWTAGVDTSGGLRAPNGGRGRLRIASRRQRRITTGLGAVSRFHHVLSICVLAAAREPTTVFPCPGPSPGSKRLKGARA